MATKVHRATAQQSRNSVTHIWQTTRLSTVLGVFCLAAAAAQALSPSRAPSLSPSPTQSPSPAPSPVPSASPSPSPTTSPSPSPSPSPTPSPTPSLQSLSPPPSTLSSASPALTPPPPATSSPSPSPPLTPIPTRSTSSSPSPLQPLLPSMPPSSPTLPPSPPHPLPPGGLIDPFTYIGAARYTVVSADNDHQLVPFFFGIQYCEQHYGPIATMQKYNSIKLPDELYVYTLLCLGHGLACWSRQDLSPDGRCAVHIPPDGALLWADCSAMASFTCKIPLNVTIPSPPPPPAPSPPVPPPPSVGLKSRSRYLGRAHEYVLFGLDGIRASGNDSALPFDSAVDYCRHQYGGVMVRSDGPDDEPQAFTSLCRDFGRYCWSNQPAAADADGPACPVRTSVGTLTYGSCSASAAAFVCKRPLASLTPPSAPPLYPGAYPGYLDGKYGYRGLQQYAVFTKFSPGPGLLPYFFAVQYCRETYGGSMVRYDGDGDEAQAFAALCYTKGLACWSNQQLSVNGTCALQAAGVPTYADCATPLPFACKRMNPGTEASYHYAGNETDYEVVGIANGSRLPYFYAQAYCREAFGGKMIRADGAGDEPQAFAALCGAKGESCWSSQPLSGVGACAYVAPGGALSYQSCDGDGSFVCTLPRTIV